MLVKCPECELQVSDKAISCPHCGYPLQPTTNKRKPRNKNNKRRRLPNGFGQISEIKNRNLRKPFRAMVTVGKTPQGRPICKPLKPESYFETYNDAYAALVEYNRNPYDLNLDITIEQLYERWSAEHFKSVGESAATTINSAWKYCHDLYSMKVSTVRARHIKGCIENAYVMIKNEKRMASAGTKSRIKALFNSMFDYAVEYEIADKNYARTFSLSDKVQKEAETARRKHFSYTDDEMKKLWDHVDDMPYVDVILIQCYSGWRPQELCLIKRADVDLENWVIVSGMKTDAGKDRPVPIHSKIKELVKRRYEESETMGSEYLINITDRKKLYGKTNMTYYNLLDIYDDLKVKLGLNPDHRPHDGRVFFVTKAKKAKVDEYAIKYIVGHTINDITEKVYTERDVSWLREEIEKIK